MAPRFPQSPNSSLELLTEPVLPVLPILPVLPAPCPMPSLPPGFAAVFLVMSCGFGATGKGAGG